MSSSVPCNVAYVLKLVSDNIFSEIDASKINPEEIQNGKPVKLPEYKILDVGCGFGKWGFLIRDTFEVMMGQNFLKKDWKIEITGVEPFDKCITNIQKEVYNKIIPEDIFKVLPKLGKYDLIIAGDVIEHFEKARSYELLDMLFEHSKNIIISTPLGFMPQGAWAGNEREIHKSGWQVSDFNRYHIVESRILQDDLFSDLLKQMPNIPDEMKKGIQLIVLWLQKR